MKAKTPSTYLNDHDTPEAAIEQAIADARSESAAARRFKRAYTPLVEALELPGNVEDNDSAIDAARDAARDALEGYGADGDGDEDGDALDTLRSLLDTYAEHTGIDLIGVLESLPDDATDEQVDALIAGAFTPLADLKGKARTGDIATAAAALGKPVDALAEILDGKHIASRKVKAEDGTESDVWGIPGDGDTFKPLSELKSIQYLGASAEVPKPTPAPTPLPTGGAGSKAATADPVADLNSRLFGGKKEK